jgi:iron complex transport system ATP-binding protein
MTLSASAVSVAFDRRVVLGPIDLDVAAGSWTCLIGPNGAGKTSFLHAVAGLVPHTGSVSVDGNRLDHLRPTPRARLVALVPQQPTIPHQLCVAEYVLLGRTPHIAPFGVEGARDHAIVGDVLERLSLLPFGSRPLGRLSGGELQRVLLARALAQQTPVLLLDEPTTALDLGHQQQVLGLVDELREEYALTVVTTMHDLTLAGAYADTLVLLADGQVVASGHPDEVLEEDVLRTYYGANVEVLTTEDGTRVIVPVRPKAPRQVGLPLKVNVTRTCATQCAREPNG